MPSPYGVPKFERIVDCHNSKTLDNDVAILIESVTSNENMQMEDIIARQTQQTPRSTLPSTIVPIKNSDMHHSASNDTRLPHDMPTVVPRDMLTATPTDIPIGTNHVNNNVDVTGVRVNSYIETLEVV